MISLIFINENVHSVISSSNQMIVLRLFLLCLSQKSKLVKSNIKYNMINISYIR